MHNLWLAFKCLSLIAGCLLMLSIIVSIVESIRDTFRESKFKKDLKDITIETYIKNIENSNKDEEK